MIEELEKQGWIYGDLPKLNRENFDKFLDIVGENNIKWLTLAQYPTNFGKWNNKVELFRGQYMLSPEGKERIRTWLESLP